jgi:DNA-binding MurR/RpiR family transcriptional regulator
VPSAAGRQPRIVPTARTIVKASTTSTSEARNAELTALLDEVALRGLRSFLVTDTLGTALQRRVELVLTVARGRADLLSMHTATLGFIEALLVGVAAKRPDETVASLKALNEARENLAGNAH